MTKSKHSLDDLLNQCESNGTLDESDLAWINAESVGKEVIDESLKSCVRFSARNYVEVMWMANLIANGVKIVHKELKDGKEVLVGIQTNRDVFPATAKWNAPVKVGYADLLDAPVHIYDDAKALEKSFMAFCGMAEVYKV